MKEVKTMEEVDAIKEEVMDLLKSHNLRARDTYTILNLCRLELDIMMYKSNKVFKE